MSSPPKPDDADETKPKSGLLKRLFGKRSETPAPDPVLPAETSEPAAPPPSSDLAVSTALALEEVAPAALEPPPPPPPPPLAPEPEPQPVAQVVAEALAEPRQTDVSAAPSEPKKNWWARLRSGLARSSQSFGTGLSEIFTKRKLDATTLDDFEDMLIRSDLGVAAALRIREAVAKNRYDKDVDVETVKKILADEVESVLAPVAQPLEIPADIKPFVILVVGVNGSGKTTTIGKLAAKFSREGKKLLLVAGDTFRAAAIEQLKIWGGRLGAEVIAREAGGDAAGLAFDAIKAAQESGAEVVIMDTAGRLQNKTELMAELEKIIRVMKKLDPQAPHAVLLVLDATVGQNAMSQVEIFGRVAGVTGLVMTKLDGTARGGILVAVADKYKLPVHFIGVGETADDLEPFAAADFARAIAGLE